MTVKELIEELKTYNQNAHVSIGDNFGNELEITYGTADGCTKETCDEVSFGIKQNNKIEIEFDYNVWE